MTLNNDGKAGKNRPIERRSLHDDVVERVRDMIVTGELPPNSRVPERIICEQLGISRTPLREALKVLAHEGLLDLPPNRGAVVTPLTVEDVNETFEVMGALEALSGELACARITEEEVLEVRALHYQMLLAYKRGDLPEYFRLNQQIHEAILTASRNHTLQSSYYTLMGRVRRARYMANLSPERWQQAVEEHETILDALTKREGERLAQILRAHLTNKAEVVKESLLVQQPDETDRGDVGVRRRGSPQPTSNRAS